MDGNILLLLAQDGVVNGAIYALLAIALVLVFAVTRVIMIPQGELVAIAALTYATLGEGARPASPWILAGLGIAAFLRAAVSRDQPSARGGWSRLAAMHLGLPAVVAGLVWFVAPLRLGPLGCAVLTISIVAPMGPFLYRIAFAPLADASVLVLLIAAVGVHLALAGLGLAAFGPEGVRGVALAEGRFEVGPMLVSGQSLMVLATTVGLMAGLSLLLSRTLTGRALRATAVNRAGARLVGIDPQASGRLAFWLAGLIGAVSGVLIAPITTVYYDSGFLIGLKGFVAAIVGGLASAPVAAVAALGVGLMEAGASFWASGFKEVIVFSAVLPVLLARSAFAGAGDDEDGE